MNEFEFIARCLDWVNKERVDAMVVDRRIQEIHRVAADSVHLDTDLGTSVEDMDGMIKVTTHLVNIELILQHDTCGVQ